MIAVSLLVLVSVDADHPRLPVFDDEPGGGAPSALAQATFARATQSLRCSDID